MAGIGEMLAGLFSGPVYQSQGGVVDPGPGKPINWGDPNLAADFFRADQANTARNQQNIPLPPRRPAGLGAPPAQAPAPAAPRFQMNPAAPAQSPFQMGAMPPAVQMMPRIAPTNPNPASEMPQFQMSPAVPAQPPFQMGALPPVMQMQGQPQQPQWMMPRPTQPMPYAQAPAPSTANILAEMAAPQEPPQGPPMNKTKLTGAKLRAAFNPASMR